MSEAGSANSFPPAARKRLWKRRSLGEPGIETRFPLPTATATKGSPRYLSNVSTISAAGIFSHGRVNTGPLLSTAVCANVKLMQLRWQVALASVLAGAGLCLHSFRALAQDELNPAVEEVAVNEATGRVLIAVVNGGILIGTIENPIEAETRLPVPVEVASDRVGVILGAVDWNSPSSQKNIARLDLDLPHVQYLNTPDAPHLGSGVQGTEASDIEAIGKPLRDRIAGVAGSIHSNLHWPENDPIVDLVIADYLSGYGPEVWQVTYALEQEQQHGDFWVTNIQRPVYTQIWPPEKGDPHTLMEFAYPLEGAPPSLLEMLRRKDAKLEPLFHSDPKIAAALNMFLGGTSNKIPVADAKQFFRAALDLIKPANARESVGIIRQDSGFEWILPPPPEPNKPTATVPSARPADAPTLVH